MRTDKAAGFLVPLDSLFMYILNLVMSTILAICSKELCDRCDISGQSVSIAILHKRRTMSELLSWDVDSEGDDIISVSESLLSDGDVLGLDTNERNYRSVYSGHNILSAYLSSMVQEQPVETGWVTDNRYVIPLHVPSVVVGHVHKRIAVCDTGTTKVATHAYVDYNARLICSQACYSLTGSMALSQAIVTIHNSMLTNQLAPDGFEINIGTTGVTNSPLVCGNAKFVEEYDTYELEVSLDGKVYKAPTSCPNTRYKAPCGLGSTLSVNSLILMYPHINQYMVSSEDRCPESREVGFLCPCSSSSSAALKGLVRFACTDTVCRCYNMGVGDGILNISQELLKRNCSCPNTDITVSIAGYKINICNTCYDMIKCAVIKLLKQSPHSPTLYSDGDVQILSFCTGALMRQQESGTWSCSNSCTESIGAYHNILAPSASLVPFPQFINTVRMGLCNTYLAQAVCKPFSDYQSNMKIYPKYSEHPIIMPNFIRDIQRVIEGCVPGLNLRVVFLNMEETYEDGIVLSRSAARRFSYSVEYTKVLQIRSHKIPELGCTIEPYSTPWWQCHFPGIVSDITRIDMDSIKVILDVTCYPVNGDKFTTLHGQKGVATIFKNEDMPVVNGMSAEIVIGTSSIIKRGTTSQLLEAAYSHYAVHRMGCDSIVPVEEVINHYIEAKKSHRSITDILNLYEGTVRINGHTIRRKEYKMSATADVAASTRRVANRQSSTGGSKGLGEMEKFVPNAKDWSGYAIVLKRRGLYKVLPYL
eukprot:scaffold25642_cov73-Attheya_sp.AAC.3